MRKAAGARNIGQSAGIAFSGRAGGQDKPSKMELGRKLRQAARDGDLGGVQRLLAQGADVDERGKGDRTALMEASLNGHDRVASLLLAKGGSVYARDSDGESPRALALRGGHTGILRMLELAEGYDAYG